MSTPTFVTHDDRRWRVLQTITDPIDGEMHELMRHEGRIGSAERHPRVIWAKVAECQEWKRPGKRRIISEPTERGRKVVLEYDERTAVVSIRLSGERKALTSTLGGLYWTLARQQASNVKRDRAFKRRHGR